MAVKLPVERPSGEQFEDLVGAVLRSRGYFLESRVVLKGESREVLELDVVATPTGDRFDEVLLVEAKRSGYSFANLFKLYGQRSFLGIPEARLVHWEAVPEAHKGDFDRVGEDTSVRCCTLRVDQDGNYDGDALAPTVTELSEERRDHIATQSWFQLIAARLGFAAFSSHYRQNSLAQPFIDARAYDLAIRRAFFEPDPIDRIRALYEAWTAAPRISGELVTWEAERRGVEPSVVWNQVNSSHDLPWLQYVMLLEHRARFGIIKNALQHALANDDDWSWEFHDLVTTPQSFHEGVEQLRLYEHRKLVPFALQLFVEGFGGFLFEEDQDRALFAECAGVPAGEIETILGFMDTFFPFSGGWFYPIKDRIQAMKVVPGMLRGSGAFLRRNVHSLEDYASHYPDMAWLLSKWHNSLYHIVESELAVP